MPAQAGYGRSDLWEAALAAYDGRAGDGTGRATLWRDAFSVALLALSYLAAREFSLLFPDSRHALMVIWPASGVALAGLLIIPRRLWVAGGAALLLVSLCSNLCHGRVLLVSAGYATAEILDAVVCAAGITWWCGQRVKLERVREVAALIGVSVVVPAGTAVIPAGTAMLAGTSGVDDLWQTWRVSGALGNLIVTPFVVTWVQPLEVRGGIRWRKVLEAVLFLALVVVFSALVFRAVRPSGILSPRPYALTGFLIWGALRFGQRGVSLALLLFMAFGVGSEAVSKGPPIWGGSTPAERILLLQAFLGFSGGFGYMMAASFTDRKRAIEIAAANGQRLAFALEASRAGIWDLNLADRSVYRSRACDRILGYEGGEEWGKLEDILLRVLPDDRDTVRESLLRVTRSAISPNVEFRVRHPDGDIRWIWLVGRVLGVKDDEHRHVLGIVQDVTVRKRAHADLRRRTLQLAQLASQLTLAEDRERLRLAGMLHDHLQQLLVGARFQTELVRSETTSPQHGRHLDLAISTLGEAIEMARAITTDLSPPILFHGELPAALEWLAQEMARKHDLAVAIEVAEWDGDLPEVTTSVLFTAVKELLLNVVKHAGVKEATVRLRRRGHAVRLDVVDAGAGFELRTDGGEATNSHFGLFSIRERIQALGGKVGIHSTPGQGTRIGIVLPLERETGASGPVAAGAS